jgi:N-acetylglucosamine kinase-like BadF-type ATPase
VSEPVVLAIDGGNSKTDLALVRADGELLSLVRGPQSSPHHLGLDGSLSVLTDLLVQATTEAGLPNGDGPVAEVGRLYLAGVDREHEEQEMEAAAHAHRLAKRITVGNDTLAVLRAGTDSGWGVAVVCGAGINCVGVAPDGRQSRFPALGWISGDWGGGYDVGLAAVSAAARSEDGRGPKTTLEQAVPKYFGFETPSQLTDAFHRRDVQERRVIELAPTVFAEAARDDTAASIVARLAGEVVTMIRVTLERIDLLKAPVDVVLGGGLMQSQDERLISAVVSGLQEVAPAATVKVASTPPVVGAALAGLDDLEAGPEARRRARTELSKAFQQQGPTDGSGRSRR